MVGWLFIDERCFCSWRSPGTGEGKGKGLDFWPPRGKKEGKRSPKVFPGNRLERRLERVGGVLLLAVRPGFDDTHGSGNISAGGIEGAFPIPLLRVTIEIVHSSGEP